MRLLTAAGVLIFSTGTALGAYLVELDGGDRMTVDSYWEDGERMHLMRGGVDLSVPKSRIRTLKPADTADDSAGVGRQAPAPSPAVERPPSSGGSGDESRRELKGRLVRIERHQVRVSQELSVAQSRGDSPRDLKRLQRELDRTWRRRQEVKRTLDENDPVE